MISDAECILFYYNFFKKLLSHLNIGEYLLNGDIWYMFWVMTWLHLRAGNTFCRTYYYFFQNLGKHLTFCLDEALFQTDDPPNPKPKKKVNSEWALFFNFLNAQFSTWRRVNWEYVPILLLTPKRTFIVKWHNAWISTWDLFCRSWVLTIFSCL